MICVDVTSHFAHQSFKCEDTVLNRVWFLGFLTVLGKFCTLYGFLLNLGITKNCSLNCELQYPVYLATAAFLLIISALPFSFFVGLYVVTRGKTGEVNIRLTKKFSNILKGKLLLSLTYILTCINCSK